MGADYDRAVEALPRLSPDERARLIDRLKALQSLAPGQSLDGAVASATDVGDDAVLAAICGAVMRGAGEKAHPAALRRAAQFRAFRPKAAALSRFAAAHAPDRARRAALLELGFDLLYKELREAGFSATARVLMSCAHQVPAVLDKGFPGYAAAGLLGMVVGCGRDKDGGGSVRAQQHRG